MDETTQQDERTLTEVIQFIADYNSVELASLNPQGLPEISYTPFIRHDLTFYIFISDLARHATNLRANPVASLMCIESERDAKQIYARQRCLMQCDVLDQASLSSEARDAVLDQFEVAHGAIIKMLRTLPDFHLFKLMPREITLIEGFGRAYRGVRSETGEWPERFKQLTTG